MNMTKQQKREYKQVMNLARFCFGFTCLMICIALVMANKPG